MKPGRSLFRLILGLATAATIGGCNDTVAGLGPPSDPTTETFAPALNVDIATMTRHPTGVFYRDSVVGSGGEVVDASDTVWVNYAGYLKDGSLFDSGTNVPFARGGVIAGFRNGVVGMLVGGSRKLVIPSDQGYGGSSQKNPVTREITIPRQSTLIFNVTLIKVHTPAATPPVTLRAN